MAIRKTRHQIFNQLNIKKLVIGYDHHFGKNREGNFEQLSEYGELYDYKVEEISAQEIESVSVSSTKIRKAIENGDIEKAKWLSEQRSGLDALLSQMGSRESPRSGLSKLGVKTS